MRNTTPLPQETSLLGLRFAQTFHSFSANATREWVYTIRKQISPNTKAKNPMHPITMPSTLIDWVSLSLLHSKPNTLIDSSPELLLQYLLVLIPV